MVFKNICVLVLSMSAVSALEGLRLTHEIVVWISDTFDDYLIVKNNIQIYFEGELLLVFCLTFLPQIFFCLCSHMKNLAGVCDVFVFALQKK